MTRGATVAAIGPDTDYAELAIAWRRGDRGAGNILFSALGAELRAIAGAQLRRERHCSLASGDLVNEAVIRLFRLKVLEVDGRSHILALASRLMRQILIDEARKRDAAKRDHGAMYLTAPGAQWEMPIDLVGIDLALTELEVIDPLRARIVEMRFFGGMSFAEVATALGISEATAKRRWTATRAWLRLRLSAPS